MPPLLAIRIYLAAGVTDMRKGFEGLYGLVRDRLSCEPLSGHFFLFCGFPRVDGSKQRTTIAATMRTGSIIRNNNDLPKMAKRCPKTKSMATAPTRPQADAIPIAVARISVGWIVGQPELMIDPAQEWQCENRASISSQLFLPGIIGRSIGS